MNGRIGALALAGLTACTAAGPAPEPIAIVQATLARYEAPWLAGAPAEAGAVFADSGVVMPHHGDPVLVGREAVEGWLAAGGGVRVITFTHRVVGARAHGDEVLGWGSFELEWQQGEGAAGRRFRNTGNFSTLLERGPDGRWRIRWRLWDDPRATEAR